ncbi:MAG: CoB--CoM heterodisulfide reductase iron-sulfur subunit B family protein, partial [Deltaproteobacteria bacterium]|nr:CoB--CoM heterodisulfide reductase iron-sulfur subunit B family protein [Deltaproteobacteria bacterium]
EKLGFTLAELPYWTCCGATFPLAEDYDMALASPTRVLARSRAEGEKVVTLCAVCHNVLKRTNHVMRTNEARRAKVTDFIQEAYDGSLSVLHYLEVLRDDVGFDAVRAKVAKPLAGLKLAPFYGCLLLRPKAEMAMDDPDRPRIFEDLLGALGAEPIDYPMKAECCGAFQVVHSDAMATRCSREILASARGRGAEALVTACPLCQFNLEERQNEMAKAEQGFKPLPVLYFTQLLDIALGEDADAMDVSRHYADPRPLLTGRGL